jgi:hypothetical protein
MPRKSVYKALAASAGLIIGMVFFPEPSGSSLASDNSCFGLQVVDEQTGAGIPLVELCTVNGIRHVTDNAGWIAWQEPGLMNTEVFWTVSGPGIERASDGFGYRGFRAVTTPGTTAVIKVKSTNIASRLGRLTGQGIYGHSERLGRPCPVPNRMGPAVMGQDSVQGALFDDKIFWLWGDTSQARYPLGNFHTTSAWTGRSAHPEQGLNYAYLLAPDNPHLLRKMLPLDRPGVVWMFGLLSLQDAETRQSRLFAGFTRQKGLVPPDERGIAEFDLQAGQFHIAAPVPLEQEWPMPGGQAVRVSTEQADHFYFCRPFAQVRVPARAASILNWQEYEMFRFDAETGSWIWQTAAAPTTQLDEEHLLNSGKMTPEQARYRLTDAGTGKPVQVHGASIQWNEFRQKFVMIALQKGDEKSPSWLGEIWYAESEQITGPWGPAVKVASHPGQTYYNPLHLAFFDREAGRIIYFEGTYTREFSGTPVGTPRYDYNQLMYRLDLGDARLAPARE